MSLFEAMDQCFSEFIKNEELTRALKILKARSGVKNRAAGMDFKASSQDS